MKQGGRLSLRTIAAVVLSQLFESMACIQSWWPDLMGVWGLYGGEDDEVIRFMQGEPAVLDLVAVESVDADLELDADEYVDKLQVAFLELEANGLLAPGAGVAVAPVAGAEYGCLPH
ncbi:hypothetical protein AB1Y20_003218 [Prymnesium parvum]|uniref:Uncharacterized protein n=1 Tax=Prymnesium parvum TaxID=97485 RepID=A0AB34JD74_PRYPA